MAAMNLLKDHGVDNKQIKVVSISEVSFETLSLNLCIGVLICEHFC